MTTLLTLLAFGGLLMWSYRGGRKSAAADSANEVLQDAETAAEIRNSTDRSDALVKLRGRWVRR